MIVDSFIYGNVGGVNIGTAGVANVGVVMRSVFDNNGSFATQIANTSTLFIGRIEALRKSQRLYHRGRRNRQFLRRQFASGWWIADDHAGKQINGLNAATAEKPDQAIAPR